MAPKVEIQEEAIERGAAAEEKDRDQARREAMDRWAMLKCCNADCGMCTLYDAGPGTKDAAGRPQALRGWRLTLATIVVFVVPLTLAVGGAVAFGPAWPGNALGAVGGLLVGVGIAAIVGWRTRRRERSGRKE